MRVCVSVGVLRSLRGCACYATPLLVPPPGGAGWGLGKGACSVVSVGVFALADEAAPRRCYARAAGTLPLRRTTPLLPLQPLPYDSVWGLNIASLCPCVSLCVCVCGGGLRRAGGGGGLLAAGPARM